MAKGSIFGKRNKIHDSAFGMEGSTKENSTINTENMAEPEEFIGSDVNDEDTMNNEQTPETTTIEENPNTEDKEQEYLVQLKDIQDRHIRLMAEFDNFRKRSLKERTELIKSAGEDILVNILPIMDDFERGLVAMESSQDVEAIKQGVLLIYNKFKDFLNQRGVKEIESLKQNFDVDLHEAITKIPAPEEDLKGKVVDVVQKGYSMNDKVIRYAKVVIGE